ncbi:hypothetical protein SAMN05444921_13159 [Streptomyces wuyuanensis]|uniref:Uncharacterized protein n=1 Tax=Streptomyces wuyuanensis TaxID=1196353 RepID=A0A1H0CWK3_9ACTN|nr:hypothetical protein SAMN05444921_13159 [Streptomyces wuyuanensis]
MMVLGISTYRAAVFPLSGPDAVDAAERMARRQAAYRLTAADGLPHHARGRGHRSRSDRRRA